MTVVRLPIQEMRVAAYAGAERQLLHIMQGTRDAYGYDGDGWDVHCDGAIAEYVVAKALNRFWLPVAANHRTLEGDVGRLQVRSTRLHAGSLILHHRDPDDAGYVLVIANPPTYRLAGWCYGHEGKRQHFWREDTGRPAFFVPQGELRPVRS
jgi:hypothetical protein